MRDLDVDAGDVGATPRPAATRTCGCAHRYLPNGTGATPRHRSQSATPLLRSHGAGQTGSRPPSRSSTPTSARQMRTESRSRSESHLLDHEEDLLDQPATSRRHGEDRPSRPRTATHWSRRSPEDLARLARLRSSSKSPVSFRESAPPAPRAPRLAAGTGYGHSYSLPRPFDTTPTEARGGLFERSRAASQSGAPYYRTRNSRPGSSAGSGGSGTGGRPTSRAMSASSLVEGPTSGSSLPQKRFITECHLEPRCIPTSYGSTVHFKKDSTWRRFVEEVRLQKCLVQTQPSTSSPCLSPSPSPRRYRTALEVWICSERPESRQPIRLPALSSA